MSTINAKTYLKSLGVVVETASCQYETRTLAPLTTTLTKVENGWTGESENISFLDGTFTANSKGGYQWSLEHQYVNGDITPASYVTISWQVRKNGIVIYERINEPISNASNQSGDGLNAFTSIFLANGEIGDYFEFFISGEDGGVNPTDTNLELMRIIAQKIREIV